LCLEEDIVVVCVGNELLEGRTVNTNLSWIGKRLEDEGYSIARSVILRDDVEGLSRRIAEIVRDRPKVLILTGGLGPTWDDVTLQGLGRALRLRMRVNREALRMIRLRTKAELTPERRKMALLPEGSTPLLNAKGTAPGVYIRKGATRIVALPGVPEEMMDIFEREVLRIIRRSLKGEKRATGRIVVEGIPEADLAPLIGEVRRRFDGVYVKSHVKHSEGRMLPIEVFLSCRGRRSASELGKAMSSLEKLASAAGGVVRVRSSPASSA